jgi:hypothetical protein
MSLISTKVKATLESEVTKLKAIIKTLREDTKLYGHNHEEEIKAMEASINNYESFLISSTK